MKVADHRSRSSSGIRGDLDDDPELCVPKLLDSKPSQPSLPDLRGALRGVGDNIPCSTSAS